MKISSGCLALLTAGMLLPVKAAPAYEWRYEDGYAYWYENGIRQGTSEDPKGVRDTQYGGIVRGREIYDPDSDAWYWLDADHDGAKAVSKDVWMPYVFQGEKSGESDGKWVRYDDSGRMVKGEQYQDGWYYFDPITGMMQKGWKYLEYKGAEVYYGTTTGKMKIGSFTIDDVEYYSEFDGRVVYTNVRDMPYFSQVDGRWANVVIGDYGAIRNNGCVCCTGTSVIDYYTGSQYTPVDVASLFNSWGHYNNANGCGHGTDTGVWRQVAQQFGMHFENDMDYNELCRYLRHGIAVTACVGNGYFVSGSWTHSILLMGLDSDGRTYVYDPLSQWKNGWYSVADIWNQQSWAGVDRIDGGPFIAVWK
ncbi:MAG: hypothetical protein IKD69_00190 [Solobacterium sp.]|nr:hypothetical protein [Solobacterium sp.]